jgi:alkanesulfonate monooxygenase SsuD/methylene tetrahydromethanopterin reductase-like flavin-dependent oxidoreductase (luciferase family)
MFRREQPPERLVAYAGRVEDAGFDELWVVEDCFYMGGIAQAATALAATNSITVGLGIAPAVARNAAFLALEFSTLARMHPSRFHGGIGHGVAEWMDQIGARPASWLGAIEETTTAVRALLRGEHLDTDGRYVRLRDVELEYVPTQAPPVSLGVRGAKSLTLSGRCADGTLLAEASAPAYIEWARERIDEGRRDAGRSDMHRVSVYAVCDVSEDDPAAARTSVRRALAPMLSTGSTSAQIAPLPYAAEIDALIAEHGVDGLESRIPDAWLDDLALAGTPEQAIATIDRLRDAGADAVILVPPAELDPDAWLNRVANELLPLARTSASRRHESG